MIKIILKQIKILKHYVIVKVMKNVSKGIENVMKGMKNVKKGTMNMTNLHILRTLEI